MGELQHTRTEKQRLKKNKKTLSRAVLQTALTHSNETDEVTGKILFMEHYYYC